ncbi:MAG: patatin-like phospholipase family protein [Acidaminococcaceae bacterium]|nr:patatin-like phospholipase family protein [Acidaminococcaceae bacterium]MDD4721992.1 patatin-like phospholipase family protein [Acidaminococcaceae bacterium]
MKKVGLALGSGGIRGFAHLGVLSVLEENDIKIDVIVGCSIGSLIGALFCCGLDTSSIMKLAKGLGRDPWLDFVVPKMGFISTKKIYEIMKLLTKGQKIEDLSIIFATVGTDLKSGKEIVFTKGSIADAVCGSICIPGVFEPYEYKDMLLADGALSNPTPIDITKKLGAEVLIAVDMAQSAVVSEIDNMQKVIVQSLKLMEKNLFQYRNLEEKCHVLIRPTFAAGGVKGMTDFSKMDEYFLAGRKAGKKALPAILKLLSE